MINKRLISQILAIIIILGGLIVMFGWFFDIPVLKSILPGQVSMKFITALSFIASGIILLLLNKGTERKEICNLVLVVLSFTLLLLMIIFFISLMTGISTGIEDMLIKDEISAIKTSIPGVPAIPTMICFILVSIAGLLTIKNPKTNSPFYLGIVTLIISIISIVGYITKTSLLYYEFQGYTPIAFNTAMLFFLIGTCLILIKSKDNQKER